jgi:hypothetical protein
MYIEFNNRDLLINKTTIKNNFQLFCPNPSADGSQLKIGYNKKHQTSNIEHQTSNTEHRTPVIDHQTPALSSSLSLSKRCRSVKHQIFCTTINPYFAQHKSLYLHNKK